MRKKILAFGASNSSRSINQQLAKYVASRMNDVDVTILDLNDFEMPIFSVDREKTKGIPAKAKTFHKLINEADGVIISFAEHNGTYTAAFKNIYDWISRLKGSIWGDKPFFVLATSPGKRGGASVLEHAISNLPRRGAQIVTSFSLPSFENNFSGLGELSDRVLRENLDKKLRDFEDYILKNSTG